MVFGGSSKLTKDASLILLDFVYFSLKFGPNLPHSRVDDFTQCKSTWWDTKGRRQQNGSFDCAEIWTTCSDTEYIKTGKKFRFQLHRRFIVVLRRLTKIFNNLCRDLEFGV